MASYNRVMLMGNLTEDVELRALPSGTSVADMRMAVSEKFKTKDGQEQETVLYVDVVAWGRQAETCKEYLSKGSPLFVEGRLQLDQWVKDGQKRSKIRVKADRIQFMAAKGSSSHYNSVSNGMNANSESRKTGVSQPSQQFRAAKSDDDLPFVASNEDTSDTDFNPAEFDKEPLPF